MNGLLQSVCPSQGLCDRRLRIDGGRLQIDKGSCNIFELRSSIFHPRSSILPPSTGSWYVSWKPKVEFILALVALILTMPFILLAAALIKLTSRGPAIYTQVRVGKNGRIFTIYKLRTMHHQAEAGIGPVWATPDDSRISPLGKLLRATHLDELPQLLNVLRGEMSLVGPRPERPEIVYHLQARIDHYLYRLTVRPGITGLAQIHLPPDLNLDGVRRKLLCDLHYIQRLGPWLDFRILVCTGLFFLGVPLQWSRRWLRIPQPLPPNQAGQEGLPARAKTQGSQGSIGDFAALRLCAR
jgi:lipopolysaccharide/colanic/teichoic acid biosynthesis glycosyltransferase